LEISTSLGRIGNRFIHYAIFILFSLLFVFKTVFGEFYKLIFIELSIYWAFPRFADSDVGASNKLYLFSHIFGHFTLLGIYRCIEVALVGGIYNGIVVFGAWAFCYLQ
jgi:hypothetical protein